MVIQLPTVANDGWVDVNPAQASDGWVDVEPAASDLSWGETGSQALKNLPSSAFHNMLGIAQQLASPGGQAGMGYSLATQPEARKALKEHFTNYLTVPGI